MLFGIIFGPISWGLSAGFFGEYESFEKGGTLISGEVISKRVEKGYRSGSDYVTIRIHLNGETQRKEIEIERLLWSHLYYTQKVDVIYNAKKKDLIKLKKGKESQFVPPILKMGLGKWVTIFSYSLLILQVVFRRKIIEYFE